MPSRYTMTGVLNDVRQGKSVIYVGSRTEGVELLRACVARVETDEILRVVKVNGKERIDHRSGGSVRIAASLVALRGTFPDVLVVDHQRDADPRSVHEYQTVLAGGRTEIVRV